MGLARKTARKPTTAKLPMRLQDATALLRAGAIQSDVALSSSLCKGRLGGICRAMKCAGASAFGHLKSPSVPLFQRGKQSSASFHITSNRTPRAERKLDMVALGAQVAARKAELLANRTSIGARQ